ncbi:MULTISPECIES: aromatic ring-hydroxylating oxygenase subunit alpha [Haloarcula]|uniref:3-phenylpropionate/cinnamic acid dioxygenase subunit alpha n=1 Tax=Haloarcula pellucida TaxID=1427151 RepID=A0A830GMQ0_9EURY|nr:MULTISPECIES: aromatic ring-hydroxylating dioxygenase subunit alpha [Halomicroarcula]MBX0349946.1 aromatic ring-hydroxylating dioxygenase subunit alpha [Halomicroarcula pellucida]MDS0279694.1 aromatic ring-hydroxylating dioxygenase subunit alpha [Halomicroarcula sp. S1AR25-4]GGN95126.1 3-phenylpropionate/cinnamic acid dioxygenase subunit alpha [Halomicroarcula pellucida]
MSKAGNRAERAEELIEQTGEALDDGKHPMRIFNDDGIYERELQRIFAKTWNFIGHESELEEPGDYARRYIGEDPYIFVRDEEGELHAFYDSCCHRGAQFVRAEQGNTSHFQCPYHGWTYRNDGELTVVPYEDERYDDLDKEAASLVEAEVETYKGFVFARVVEDGPSLDEYLEEFKWYLDIALDPTEEGLTVVGEPRRVRAEVDWKVPGENFAGDSYHLAHTHGSSFELEYSSSIWERFDAAGPLSQSYSVMTDTHAGEYYLFDEEPIYMDYPEKIEDHMNSDLSERQREMFSKSMFITGTIFPNASIWHGFNPIGGPWASIRLWRPVGPGESEIVSWLLVPKELEDDEEFLERAKAGYQSLSPGGVLEADDTEVWSGISESSNSATAIERDVRADISGGLEESDAVPITDGSHGPGEVIRAGPYLDEVYARTLFNSWHEFMSEQR